MTETKTKASDSQCSQFKLNYLLTMNHFKAICRSQVYHIPKVYKKNVYCIEQFHFSLEQIQPLCFPKLTLRCLSYLLPNQDENVLFWCLGKRERLQDVRYYGAPAC